MTRRKSRIFSTAAQTPDLVLGSRYSGGVRVLNWPLKRLLLSRFAGIYVWLITGMPFTDPTGGYKCFRRRALQAITLDAIKSNGYSFQIEMTHRLWREGFTVAEVPIIFADRVEGTSKLSRRHRRGGVLDGLVAVAAKRPAPLAQAAPVVSPGVPARAFHWESTIRYTIYACVLAGAKTPGTSVLETTAVTSQPRLNQEKVILRPKKRKAHKKHGLCNHCGFCG